MKAREIIFEAQSSMPSQAVTIHQLKTALPQIKIACEAVARGARLLRGLRHTDRAPFLHKPQMPLGGRVSANTENYYTLFVDNDASWSAYPARSASMICTTHMSTASGYSSGYGSPYLVLPELDPRVAVCPASDFWISFDRLRKLGSYLDLADLNRMIRVIMQRWFGEDRWQPNDFSELAAGFSKIDQHNYLSFPELPDMPETTCEKLLSFMPGTTIMEKFRYLLDPTANDFEVYELSHMPKNLGDREVWCSAPAWFINTGVLPEDWQSDANFDLAEWISAQ